MSDPRFTPEEFARLLSLPPDHPDRRRAESDPGFEAWQRMLREFESPDAEALPKDEAAWADAELEARLADAIAPAQNARRERPVRRAWWQLPATRPALAFASLAVVTFAAWWGMGRGPESPVARGVESAPLEWREARESQGTLPLEWTAAPGADSYRLVFSSARLEEVARVEGLTSTRYALDPTALPAGLERGRDVVVEVQALHGADVLLTSRSRPLRIP
jgi:hypothetical protein